MELKRKLGFLIVFSCCFSIGIAQNGEMNCKVNYRNALQYLQGNDSVQKDSLKGVALLVLCASQGASDAQLLLGQLYLKSTQEKLHKQGFALVREAAEQGNVAASCELGILYKYGKGCRLSLDSALYWFQKAAEGGSSKAAYSMGYMYYKGLGTVSQDYSKAVDWFQSSTHPMAQYWLAICYYYGYGVAQNTKLAMDLLSSNEQLGDGFGSNQWPEDSATEVENNRVELDVIDTLAIAEEIPFSAAELNGSWSGYLAQFDWSGTRIEQVFPVSLEMAFDASMRTIRLNWQAAEVYHDGFLDGTTLYFEDLYLTLPRLDFGGIGVNSLLYQVLSSRFAFKEYNNSLYVTAALESHINAWNEPGAPMSLVLTKNDGVAVTSEVLEALAVHKDSFIKVYPNPFQSQLLISYTLNTPAEVFVRISSFDGTFSENLVTPTNQSAGMHQVYYSGHSLVTGNYVVQIEVDGELYSKVIVKNKL